MNRIKLSDILAVLISAIPFVLFLLLRDSLPDRMPIHWDAGGQVNGWATKNEIPVFLSVMTAVGLGVYLLMRFIKALDPKRSAQLNDGVASKVGVGIVVFIAAVNVLVLLAGSIQVNTATVVIVLVSLLFTFLGNLMYNIKPNYFIGMRLPWTLENETNWRLTHRLAGVVWFIGGIVSAVLAILLEPNVMFGIFISITIILVIVPTVYSFILYKRTAGHSH